MSNSICRGDIYWVKVPQSHTVGREQFKRRPWVVISRNSANALGLAIGIPLCLYSEMTPLRHFRIQVLASEILLEDSSDMTKGVDRLALTHQVRALSVDRFDGPRQGTMTAKALASLEAGLSYILEMPLDIS